MPNIAPDFRGSDAVFAIAIFFIADWIVDYVLDRLPDGMLAQ
jgi:hypothetical protein